MILRPYQIDGINRLRAEYASGRRAPIYQLSTGGGKSLVISGIVRGAVAKGRRVVVMAHRRELIYQLHRKLNECGVTAGIIMPGHPEEPHPVQVASVQTLARRTGRFAFDLVVIDEGHHCVAGSAYDDIIQAYPGAALLGVTATPCRLDGKGLGKGSGGLFDGLVCGPEMRWLIENGFLADWRAFCPDPGADLDAIKTTAGDFNKGALADAMNKRQLIGDAVRHYQELGGGRKGIAFTVSVDHARNMADMFTEAGIPAIAVDGGMGREERDAAFAGFAGDKYKIVCSCELISEGYDVPEAAVAILARPTKSLTMFRQQIGRVLRPKADGSKALILDHAGNIMRHGAPDDPVAWSLEGRPPRDKKEKQPPRCKECQAFMRIGAEYCTECGAVRQKGASGRELVEKEGDLVEFQRGQQQQKRKQVGRARTEAELWQIARERGYKPGWVYQMLRARERRG